MNKNFPRSVAIVGPTATGKSSLAIQLAKKFNGEIISADSRQVYKGMDLGSGKVTKKEQKIVPHHLLDVASPKKQFTVAQFKKLADKKIRQIISRGKLPIIVGGTAFYIYSLIDNLQIPEIKPNLKLRKELRKKTAEQLYALLKKSDPRRAKNIDRHNPVRLIRAIEIVKTSGKPVPIMKKTQMHNTLFLGLNKPQKELYKNISKRLDARLKNGLVKEVKKLVASGVSHKKLDAFGLEYRYVSKYLQNNLSYKQMVEELKKAIQHFAKRQMTWFKKDSRIVWVKNLAQAEKLAKKYLATE
jgi:tRNA dimethylallyltransferase